MVEEQSSGAIDLTEYKEALSEEVLKQVSIIKDYPKPGVNFMDLFSITEKPDLFRKVIEALKYAIEVEIGKPGVAFNMIYGLEARGLVLGPILALEWRLPFQAIRKKGKLPGEIIRYEYDLEYGSDVIEMEKKVFTEPVKILLVDDLLATGGTLTAAENLISQIPNATVVASVCPFEIPHLKGRNKLKAPFVSLFNLD